jgi:hypothetical protein
VAGQPPRFEPILILPVIFVLLGILWLAGKEPAAAALKVAAYDGIIAGFLLIIAPTEFSERPPYPATQAAELIGNPTPRSEMTVPGGLDGQNGQIASPSSRIRGLAKTTLRTRLYSRSSGAFAPSSHTLAAGTWVEPGLVEMTHENQVYVLVEVQTGQGGTSSLAGFVPKSALGPTQPSVTLDD